MPTRVLNALINIAFEGRERLPIQQVEFGQQSEIQGLVKKPGVFSALSPTEKF